MLEAGAAPTFPMKRSWLCDVEWHGVFVALRDYVCSKESIRCCCGRVCGGNASAACRDGKRCRHGQASAWTPQAFSKLSWPISSESLSNGMVARESCRYTVLSICRCITIHYAYRWYHTASLGSVSIRLRLRSRRELSQHRLQLFDLIHQFANFQQRAINDHVRRGLFNAL